MFNIKILKRKKIGSKYMKRLYIFMCNWFGIMYHNMLGSDQDRSLHNHPFNFITIILKRGYIEHRVDFEGNHYKLILKPFRIYYRSKDVFHSIELHKDPEGRELSCKTLVFTGRKVQDWGFLINNEFISHETLFD